MSDHVAIVCHDAGGAEILSSWLKRYRYSSSVVVSGPAEKIFRYKCPNADFLKLDDALIKCNWILAGTGWQTNFEIKAISKAQKLGIKSVAYLDHWVNYRARFKKNGYFIFPNEIWVGDTEAERIAKNQFDKIPIVLKPNPYFEDLLEEISFFEGLKSNNEIKNKVLYVCEPVADHAFKQHGNILHWGYTEKDALRFFLKNITALRQRVDQITIRTHPSEHKDKYKWVNRETNLPIQISSEKTLVQEINNSDTIVGCESMAMVVGLLAKKRVISTIPPGGRSCQLPHRNIEKMQQLVKSAGYLHD